MFLTRLDHMRVIDVDHTDHDWEAPAKPGTPFAAFEDLKMIFQAGAEESFYNALTPNSVTTFLDECCWYGLTTKMAIQRMGQAMDQGGKVGLGPRFVLKDEAPNSRTYPIFKDGAGGPIGYAEFVKPSGGDKWLL